MKIQNFKQYINGRPFITENFSDEDLTKTLNFAELLLDTFFNLTDEFKESNNYNTILFEEAIYLLQNDPTSEYLTKYEGLTQFNVAGAISASVAEEYLPFISRFVKLILQKYGFLPVVSDSSKITYNYTTF
jgi:hypothetical protein